MHLTLARPLTNGWVPDPPRYRAARRRSIRTALAVAGLLVAGTALTSIQYPLRQIPSARELVLLGGLQTVVALLIVLAMRTRVRRYPAAVAFGYLLFVPLVPLATLGLEPDSVVLVASSLALIPVGVALFIAWDHRTYRLWAGSFLVVVTGATMAWASPTLGTDEAWYLVLAVTIGLVFGILGQRQRDRNDRLAFGRERILRSLVQQSTAQQAALERLNGELDRVLGREVQGRQSIEAALAAIDPGASPDEIAATACAQIVKLPSVDCAWVISLATVPAVVLAQAGRSVAFPATSESTDAWSRDLMDRASRGAWADLALPASGTAFGFGPGPVGSVWSPLRGSRGVIGVIGCGTHDPDLSGQVAELLPAITTYGSMVGALVAPGFEALGEASRAQARIREILDTQAYAPHFQPIVDLRTGEVSGYEALTRFANGERPDVVFELAREAGLGTELEVATLTAALSAATVLPRDVYLGLNASPDLLDGSELGPLLAGVARPIVIEITEHLAIDDYARVRAAVGALGHGVRLAVDDAGAGYASLRHILELAPDYMKLDIGLIRGIDSDPARQALIAGVGYFAVKRRMRLVAEGIETPAELATVRSLGVGYGQGYLLGRPRDGRDPGPWLERFALR